MASVTVDLPEALTAEIEEAVSAGWFSSESEAIKLQNSFPDTVSPHRGTGAFREITPIPRFTLKFRNQFRIFKAK